MVNFWESEAVKISSTWIPRVFIPEYQDISPLCTKSHLLEYKHTQRNVNEIHIMCNIGIMILISKPWGVLTFISCCHSSPDLCLDTLDSC